MINSLLNSLVYVALMGNTGARPTTWDWNGVIGTGQSLSCGAQGQPVKSTTQPYKNLKVATGMLQWPIDPNDPGISLAPLVEPVGRLSPSYPSAWPENTRGETPHSAAGNEISALSLGKLHKDLVTVHAAVGEDGQGMIFIKKNPQHKGVNGRSYEAAMIQAKAISRLAKAAHKSFGVGGILMTHGETDTGNAQYEDQLYQLWSDYNTDLKAITGQKQDVVMIVSQHNRLGEYSPSTIAQWSIGDHHPHEVVCSGPKYQYPYAGDGLHLNPTGYQMLGEKYGQVYFERVVLGSKWRPLEPLSVTRNGKAITLKFNVPRKPLVWDKTLGNPHPSTPEWAKGNGFEVTDSKGARVTIESAAITKPDTVVVTCATDPGSGARLSYALIGENTMKKPPFNAAPHWGILRDSDPFVGMITHMAQPNFCVAFVLPVP